MINEKKIKITEEESRTVSMFHRRTKPSAPMLTKLHELLVKNTPFTFFLCFLRQAIILPVQTSHTNSCSAAPPTQKSPEGEIARA